MRRFLIALALLSCAIPVSGALANGAFVYSGATSDLYQFAAGPTGLLTALSPGSVQAPGQSSPSWLVELPNQTRLYAPMYNDQFVASASVAPDGKVTFSSGQATGSGSQPEGEALSPDLQSLYVADHGSGGIHQYTVTASGTLAPKSPASVAVPFATDIVVTPDGTSAYASSQLDGIDSFDVTPGGLLVAKAGANATTAVGGAGDALGMTADGRFLVVGTPAGVRVLAIGAGGALTAVGGAVPGPASPLYVTVSPDGRSVYVSGSATDLYLYSLSSAGALTAQSPATRSFSPQFAGQLAISPDGHSAYVPAGAVVNQFDIGATGGLTPKAPAGAAAATFGQTVTVSPDELAVAGFTAAIGAPGSPTTFDASKTIDPDGTVVRYDWDFGDGTAAANGGAKVSHIYATDGIYTASVRVTDNRGCSAPSFTGHQWLCHGSGSAAQALTVGNPAVATTPDVPVTTPNAPARSAKLVRLGVAKITISHGRYRLVSGYGLSCSPGVGACRGQISASLLVAGRKHGTGLNRSSFTVKAGTTSTVGLTVSSRFTATFTKLRTAKLAITLASSVPSGTGARLQRTVTRKVPALHAHTRAKDH